MPAVSVLEEVDEVLGRHRHEAAVGVGRGTGVSRVLPEENAAVPAEVQGIPILLLGWVVLLQGKIHQLPLDVALLREDQVSTELLLGKVVLAQFLPQLPVFTEHVQRGGHLAQSHDVPPIREAVQDVAQHVQREVHQCEPCVHLQPL